MGTCKHDNEWGKCQFGCCKRALRPNSVIHDWDGNNYDGTFSTLCGKKLKDKSQMVDWTEYRDEDITCKQCLRIKRINDDEHVADLNAQHQNHANPSFKFKDRRIV